MELLTDSSEGFAAAAEKLAESDRADLAPKFRSYADQRTGFYTQLEVLAAAYGDDLEESGSLKAAAHRMWMTVKDTLAGSDPDGVLSAAVNGEEYAVSTYTSALNERDLSAGLRSTLEDHLAAITAAHSEIRSLANAAT